MRTGFRLVLARRRRPLPLLARQIVVDGVGIGARDRLAGHPFGGLAGVVGIATDAGHVHAGSQRQQEAGDARIEERWSHGCRSCVALVAWSSRDRKSTRLNSSHHSISYAVFCLKKKK